MNVGDVPRVERSSPPMNSIFLPSACLVIAALAVPMGLQWNTASVSWTEPAGVTSGTVSESLVPSEFFAVQALKLWDFDGRACSLQLEQGNFNTPSSRPLDPVRFCEPKQTQAWKRADIGLGQFVTAISVCTALKDQGAQIHGVELWGAALDSAGKLKPAKQSVKLELAHCEKWSTRRTCPAGSVATGVRAHLGDSDSGAIGLALRCHKLSATP
jgi:hypothetical protein